MVYICTMYVMHASMYVYTMYIDKCLVCILCMYPVYTSGDVYYVYTLCKLPTCILNYFCLPFRCPSIYLCSICLSICQSMYVYYLCILCIYALYIYQIGILLRVDILYRSAFLSISLCLLVYILCM